MRIPGHPIILLSLQEDGGQARKKRRGTSIVVLPARLILDLRFWIAGTWGRISDYKFSFLNSWHGLHGLRCFLLSSESGEPDSKETQPYRKVTVINVIISSFLPRRSHQS